MIQQLGIMLFREREKMGEKQIGRASCRERV